MCVTEGTDLFSWGLLPSSRDSAAELLEPSSSATQPATTAPVPIPGGCNQSAAWRSSVVAFNMSGELFEVRYCACGAEILPHVGATAHGQLAHSS